MKRLGILFMATCFSVSTVYAQGETGEMVAAQESVSAMPAKEGGEDLSTQEENAEDFGEGEEAQPETETQATEAESQAPASESQSEASSDESQSESTSEETSGSEAQSETTEGQSGEGGKAEETDSQEETSTEKESEATEAESEATEAETEVEEQQDPILVAMTDGTALVKEPLVVPETLTVGEETYPVDYMQGVYKVKVPTGTETIQITVADLEEGETLSFTKWGGYLTELEQHWYLCPDDPVEEAYTQSENVYTIYLDKFAINMEEITQEQLSVYGELTGEESWGEVLVTGENRSELLLIEFAQQEAQTESEPETELPIQAVAIASESAIAVASASATTVNSAYKKAGESLSAASQKYTPTVGSIGGEWEILGLARSGKLDSDVADKYLANVISTLKECNGVLHEKKYTEYSRVILALTSMGVDITNVGGYNLLEPLADYDKTVWQGLNGAVWALIAVDSRNYEFPEAASGVTQNSREKLINNILAAEVSGGGWDFSGNSADPDMTGMALQALAPYYNSNTKVKAAVDRAITKLSNIQKPNGSYATYGTETVESCAQVIVALTALGIDPNTDSRFSKNRKSVVDALLTYINTDGSFCHVLGGGANQMATEQAYYALTAYERFVNGENSLYDMTDADQQSNEDKAKAVKNVIAALPGTITLADKSQIEGAKAMYENLNATQKALVTNYSKLESALKQLKELEKNSSSSKNGQSETNKNSGSTTKKKLSGSTKSVNLAGSTKSGGTVIGKSSSEKTSSTSKTKESEKNKKTSDKTTAASEKKGATKTDQDVTRLITEMTKLFRTTGTSKKLPDNAADYSDEEKEQILDLFRTYEKLTDVQKEEVEESSYYKEYQKSIEGLKEVNHYDDVAGVDLRDNEEDVIPWYVQVNTSSLEVETDQANRVSEALKDQGQLLNLTDISLTDLLNEQTDWEPEDLVRVSIPLVDLGDYEKVAIAHFKNDGSIEFLEGHIAGDQIEFDTDGFSKFGVVGYNGFMEEIMKETKAEKPIWMYVLPGAGAVGLLAVLGIARLSMAKSEKKKKANGEDGER